jgi:hypothetical protein
MSPMTQAKQYVGLGFQPRIATSTPCLPLYFLSHVQPLRRKFQPRGFMGFVLRSLSLQTTIFLPAVMLRGIPH